MNLMSIPHRISTVLSFIKMKIIFQDVEFAFKEKKKLKE